MMLFLVLKIVKNGYYGNGALFLAWDLGLIFLGLLNSKILGFRKKKLFFLIQIFKFYRKICGLHPCIPIFRGFFLLKSAKKMCMHGFVKNRIVTCGKCIFSV